MSESLRIADHLWNAAEELVDRVEHSCQVESAEQVVYDQLTRELLPISGAATVAVWVSDQSETSTISLNGAAPAATDPAVAPNGRGSGLPSAAGRFGTSTEWLDPLHLMTTAAVTPQTTLGLTLRFPQPVDGALARPLCELSEALLGLITTHFLRHRYAALCLRHADQTRRDRVIDELNQGIDLQDSFAAIAQVLAEETGADRVSLLRLNPTSCQLLASSTQPRVNRRARQVRLLEQLVPQVTDRCDQFHFAVGYPPTETDDVTFTQSLNQYVSAAGCREIHIDSVFQPDHSGSSNPVAALVMERFHVEPSAGAQRPDPLEQWRAPVQAAINRAIGRHQISWSTIFSRLAALRSSRRVIAAIGIAMLITMALAMIPVELKIPVEGRLTATLHRRVFAPADAVVSKLTVRHGQPVTPGQTLLILRSDQLDQQQRQLEGALATAEARLAIAAASKSQVSGARGSDPGGRSDSASSNEKVLQAEISGLQKQLALIDRQQTELHLKSPIEGKVDRWDLTQSLSGRPVVHGQFLIDVVSRQEGWTVELDIPDVASQYVIDAQASEPCPVTFRLRSNPDQVFTGELAELASATQLNTQGQPVMRSTLHLDEDPDHRLRTGASVLAHIHCGSKPLGFVWFRSVIEWLRRADWL